MFRSSWLRLSAVLLAGLLVGGTLVLTNPASADLRARAGMVWKKMRPKADQRYIQKAYRANFARVATATGEPVPLNGYADILAMGTTITAPVAGYLVVEGRGTYTIDSGSPLLHCGISVDGDEVWQSTDSRSSSVLASSGPVPCDTSATIPVAAGSHRVDYVTHNDAVGAATFRGGSLTVTFVQFGPNGARPQVPAPSARRLAEVPDLNR